MTAPEFTKCPAGHVRAGAGPCRACSKTTVPGTVIASTKYRAPQDFRWRDKAACADKDPELFQPHDEVTAHRAMRICREDCPVILQCAIEAKAQGPWIVGVWAGKWHREPTVKKPKGEGP